MLAFLSELLKTRLQLGYLLLSISTVTILFSAHKSLAPGAIIRSRTLAASPATSTPCTSVPTGTDSDGLLSLNAQQLASIERYVAATAPICSSLVTSAVGTDAALGIEPDIANWCRPLPRVLPRARAHMRAAGTWILISRRKTQPRARGMQLPRKLQATVGRTTMLTFWEWSNL